METAEGKRREELAAEFKTLNGREKDYILGFTRVLSSAVKKMTAVSKAPKPESRNKNGLQGRVKEKT